jgi:putative hydrolase of the HAD superfamily
MKTKLVIFDFWKTLASAPEYDPQKFFFSLGKFGIEMKGKEEAKRFSSFFSKLMRQSKDWTDFSEQLLSEFKKEKDKKSVKVFADFLKENIAYKIYGDVKEILNIPYEKAILTDSARFFVENSELKNFGRIFTPVETKSLKPDPKVFLTVINDFKIKPEECVMVGDDVRRDLVSAKNLGMKTILIDRENRYPEYKGTKINSFSELETALEGL